MKRSWRWDVAIAGGGPAGATAALLLARAGRRVLLATCARDAGPAGEALPPAARPLLRDLRVSSDLTAGHLTSLGNHSAWGSDELHASDFISNVYGIGFHLDRPRFDASLCAAAAGAGATVVTDTRVEARLNVRLRMAGREEPLDCRWIVDATGRASTVAIACGATRRVDDGLVAFCARFVVGPGTSDRNSRTVIESCPEGWWYTTRISSRERVVAFLTDMDLAPTHELLSPSGFKARLDKTTHIREVLRLSAYTMVGRVRGAVAASSRLDLVAGSNWIAVGDAALAFDPLSSQGVFNAIYTGMKAGEAVDAALAGDDEALAQYALRIDAIYDSYRNNLAAFYSRETRWPKSSFWNRRLTLSRPQR